MPINDDGATCVILDDDVFILSLLEFIMREANITAVASDSFEAVKDYIGPATFIITDVLMDGESGIDIARKIKSEYPNKPIIFLTGVTDAYNQLIMSRISPHIVHKPLDLTNMKALQTAVNRCVYQ